MESLQDPEHFGQNEKVTHILLSVGVTTAFQPLTYAKTLIQLGFEPLDPIPTTSLFGRSVLAYPNVFKYLSFIRKEDGFFGLYRGLTARIVGGLIGQSVSVIVNDHLSRELKSIEGVSNELDGDKPASGSLVGLKRVCRDTTCEMIGRCTGIVISHPFQVLMVRTMAQFVGKETKYSYFFTGLFEIYRSDGILGYFSGLIPRIIGEVLTVWMANLLCYAVTSYLLPKDGPLVTMKNYSAAVCSLIVSQFVYPFSVVSNVMIVNNTGLAVGDLPYSHHYANWRSCWHELSKQGELKRGSSLFWRNCRRRVIWRPDGTPVHLNFQ